MNCESAENLLHTHFYSDPVGDSDTEIIEQIESAEMEGEIQEDDLFDETFETTEIVLDKSDKPLKKKETVSVVNVRPPATRGKAKARAKKDEQESGELGKVHICEMCGSSYKYRHALEVHMRRHRGDR